MGVTAGVSKMMLFVAISLLLSASLASEQENAFNADNKTLGTSSLFAVTVVTGVGSDCGSNSDIYIHIDGMNHEHCQTNYLDNVGNDFTPGSTGVYQGELLGGCLTTDFPDGVFEFVVHHKGIDGWCMEAVTLEFNNGYMVTCDPDNIFLDDDQSYTCDVFKN